jgi:hypothetical protein
VLRVSERVLDREDAAPRLSVEHEALRTEPECDPDLLHLVDEPLHLPQGGVVGLVAVVRPELVVEVVLDAGGR